MDSDNELLKRTKRLKDDLLTDKKVFKSVKDDCHGTRRRKGGWEECRLSTAASSWP